MRWDCREIAASSQKENSAYRIGEISCFKHLTQNLRRPQSPAWVCLERKMRRRLRKEMKEGHTWLSGKTRFESLEGKKEENLEGSRIERQIIPRRDLCCYTAFFQVWCCWSFCKCFPCLFLSVCEQHPLFEGAMDCVTVTGRAPSHCTDCTKGASLRLHTTWRSCRRMQRGG